MISTISLCAQKSTSELTSFREPDEHSTYIPLNKEYFGIRSLFDFRPETAKIISLLAEELLQTEVGLTKGEREIIATYVSKLNNCYYCSNSHGATAKYLCNEDETFVQNAVNDPENSKLSPKMKALLAIAKEVQQHGQNVTQKHFDEARKFGATDIELHDTVLITAFFCMCNRYVDGLGTIQPKNIEMYDKNGKVRAKEGYLIKSAKK